MRRYTLKHSSILFCLLDFLSSAFAQDVSDSQENPGQFAKIKSVNISRYVFCLALITSLFNATAMNLAFAQPAPIPRAVVSADAAPEAMSNLFVKLMPGENLVNIDGSPQNSENQTEQTHAGAISEISIAVSGSRIVTAMRDGGGNLKLITWDIGTDGSISRRGTAAAGAISKISIARVDSSRVVTAMRDGGGNLRLITWDIGIDGFFFTSWYRYSGSD